MKSPNGNPKKWLYTIYVRAILKSNLTCNTQAIVAQNTYFVIVLNFHTTKHS